MTMGVDSISGNYPVLYSQDAGNYENKYREQMSAINSLEKLSHKDEFVSDKSDKKNIFQIILSAAAAVAASYATGKAVAYAGQKILPGLSDLIVKKGGELAKTAAGKINSITVPAGKGKLAKLSEIANKSFDTVKELGSKAAKKITSKGGKEAIARVAGLTGVAIGTPNIINADNNNDGIKDFTQKSVSAYENITSNLGVLGDVIKALS